MIVSSFGDDNETQVDDLATVLSRFLFFSVISQDSF
jgi:hypothetical protein